MSSITSPIFFVQFFVIVFIIIFSAFTIYFYKSQANLKSYVEFLKEQNRKLKEKNKKQFQEPTRDVIINLLKECIEMVKTQYKNQFNEDISTVDDNFRQSKEKLAMIHGYQLMVAELNILENSLDASRIWERIYNELYKLISISYVEDDSYKLTEQLKNAHQRITNLEKFKQLYFELQDSLADSVGKGEAINAEILESVIEMEDNKKLIELIEKHNQHYIKIGVMADMDQDKHHYSVRYMPDFAEQCINERKTEVKRLKSKVAQQFEEIWALQNRLSLQNSNHPDTDRDNIDLIKTPALNRQLKDAELCIETMEMEINTMKREIDSLKQPLEPTKQTGGLTISMASDNGVERQAQDYEILLDKIHNLEKNEQKHLQTVTQLNEELEQNKSEYNKLEQKYLILDIQYSDIEQKYQNSINS